MIYLKLYVFTIQIIISNGISFLGKIEKPPVEERNKS
jgi:hypothetical protein